MSDGGDIGALLREARERAAQGEKSVMATIVRTRGSTPRKVGAKMVVLQDGLLLGSVGGGCGEADVFEAAMDVLTSNTPRLMHVDLTADETSESGDVCGGIMDVFIEPLRFSPMIGASSSPD